MTLTRIIEQVCCRPWLITGEAHFSIRTLLENKLNGTPLEANGGSDFFPPKAKLEIEGNTAIIPIHGIIGKGLSNLEKSCGAVGIEDISAMVSAVSEDESIERVILDIDSPGGVVSGVPELAEEIAVLRETKELTAVVSQMSSAAYWLGVSAHKIVVTPSAMIGSIGVYLAVFDQSEAFRASGLRVEIIKAGRLKAAAFPGTSLSKDQRIHLQETIDDIYQLFTEHVTRYRPQVTSDTMQGQSFMGNRALRLGLADEVVSRIDNVGKTESSASEALVPQTASSRFSSMDDSPFIREYENSPTLQSEFSSPETYSAYRKAVQCGLCEA